MKNLYSLQIVGFRDDAKEWDVKMFLSSRNYSGGGEILRLEYDESKHSASVTYINPAG